MFRVQRRQRTTDSITKFNVTESISDHRDGMRTRKCVCELRHQVSWIHGLGQHQQQTQTTKILSTDLSSVFPYGSVHGTMDRRC